MKGRFANESDMNRTVSRWLTEAGAFVFATVGNTMQRAGLPDRYVAHRTWTGWLEGKWGDRQLTTLQRLTLRELHVRGVAAYELRWADDTDTWRVRTHDGVTLWEVGWAAVTGASVRPGMVLLEGLAAATARCAEKAVK